jgi:uncharacterized protein YndB with AHSA1/START domain
MAPLSTTSPITLQIQRRFPAPREKVFRAWTDPKEISRWFAPSADYTVVVPVLDLRVGGIYCLEMHHKGGDVLRLTGSYREIEPPKKVVFTWRWETNPDAGETLVTIELRDMGPSTDIVLTHEQFPNEAQREQHNQGWEGCLNQLVTIL